MATSQSSSTDAPPHQPSEFELRRTALVGQIGDSLEQVLTQMNALNRNLEGIIEIGNEFASVEALWSQFESVMGREAEGEHEKVRRDEGDGDGDGASEKEERG